MSTSFYFCPRTIRLEGAPPEPDRLLWLLRGHASRVALDSAAGSPNDWSLVAFDPLPGQVEDAGLDALRSFVNSVECRVGDEVPGPFAGGFLGALSYDLGVAGEGVVWHSTDPLDTPKIVGALYVDFLVIDHAQAAWWLVLGETPGDGRAEIPERRARILRELRGAVPSRETPFNSPEVTRRVSSAEHQRRVECARASIAKGDYYQTNLAHRFTAELQREPDDLYRALREANPAPYMAYLEWGEGTEGHGALLSASPELLLEFDGSRARTRPIKGTARRSKDPFEDAQLARDLMASAKDRAELAMIVDLERNDLGRVAKVGSVSVGKFPRLESFESVHHLVADVECEIRPDVDAIGVLKAIFPGGSITGAPKLAAMKAIAEHEGEGRGFFTGSLGFLDFAGRACFNILIRTLVWQPNSVSFHVGGGITWSSNAAAEDQETWVKARSLVEALTGVVAREAEGTEV